MDQTKPKYKPFGESSRQLQRSFRIGLYRDLIHEAVKHNRPQLKDIFAALELEASRAPKALLQTSPDADKAFLKRLEEAFRFTKSAK